MTGPSEQNLGITSGERSSMHGDSGWLERRAQNLGMAESKSTWFALSINAHSEKSRRFDLNGYKRLADISECRDRCPRISVRGAPGCTARLIFCLADVGLLRHGLLSPALHTESNGQIGSH